MEHTPHRAALALALGIAQRACGDGDTPPPDGACETVDATDTADATDTSGTVRFHVPATTGSEGCVDYIGPDHGGTCCLWGGGCRAQGEFDGPMVVAGGFGGTHGWSTVRMFSVVPAGIEADPGTP